MENNIKEPLKMEMFRDSYDFPINKELSLDRLEYLAGIEECQRHIDIDYDVYLPTKGCNLQRPFCWTDEQKSDLIRSIFMRLYIPPMTIVQHEDENEHVTYQIIDGKQRLNAMIGFLKNEFPLIYNGNTYYYRELDDDMKMFIGGYMLYANVAYEYHDEPISDDDKIRMFLKVNYTGTVQDGQYLKSLDDMLNK